jgi:hypothetical protein
VSDFLKDFVLAVLAGAFLGVFMSILTDLDLEYRVGIGITIIGVALMVSHAASKHRESVASQPEVAAHKGPPPVAGSTSKTPKPITKGVSHATEQAQHVHGKPVSQATNHEKSALSSMSDGQRVVLKDKLAAYRGSTVRLVLVGNDPFTVVAFEQLKDIFQDSGWNIQDTRIGLAVVVGPNFPSRPYMTAENVSTPIVTTLYSIFSNIGIDLPLVPDAFSGSGRPCDVVIVVH